MKDSWTEYDDGGIVLRNYFLERVSRMAPVVLERLRPGLERCDYYQIWCFLKEWSQQCHVDTDWFRESGEFTLREWSLGSETKKLVCLGGRVVPITLEIYPLLHSTNDILKQYQRACEAAGLIKADTHQAVSTRRRVRWLIAHDVLEKPTRVILKTQDISERKFYTALYEIRERLGIPQPA